MRRFVGIVRDERPDLEVSDDLEDLLRTAIARAEAAWPEVRIEHEPFVRFVAARLGEGDAGRLAALATDDLYLACACIARDPAALRTFDRTYVTTIERAVTSTGATPTEVVDLRQIVRVRLLVPTATEAGDAPPRLASYSGRGSLASWIRVVATREAARLLSRERREVAANDDALLGMITPDDDPEIAYLKRLYRAEFKAAFQAAVASLSDRGRMLLQQHVIDRLGIDQLAVFYRVHRTTTARWLDAARQEVLAHTRKELIRRLELSGDELDSVMRLIISRLDVSLPALLRARA